jgi:hypothetical protein
MSEVWSDKQIRDLVWDLESLRGGAFASAALIGCGARAIEPLRTFLLQGKPRGIFQPRQLAVETLAELGAREVLIEYLTQARTITDRTVLFAEAAVESTAARALSRWRTEDVYRALKSLADTKLLPGLVEALGEFGRVEMLPYFLWALGDDECREAGEEALRKLGQSARPALMEAAKTANPSTEEEIPSSRIRRRKVLRILADGETSAAEWQSLKNLLNDNDPEIAITCARIALECALASDQQNAVHKLIELLPRIDWFLKTEARLFLAEHFEIARDQIEQEIARRSSVSGKERSLDIVLRLLVNLKTQLQSRHDREAKSYAKLAHT